MIIMNTVHEKVFDIISFQAQIVLYLHHFLSVNSNLFDLIFSYFRFICMPNSLLDSLRYQLHKCKMLILVFILLVISRTAQTSDKVILCLHIVILYVYMHAYFTGRILFYLYPILYLMHILCKTLSVCEMTVKYYFKCTVKQQVRVLKAQCMLLKHPTRMSIII